MSGILLNGSTALKLLKMCTLYAYAESWNILV